MTQMELNMHVNRNVQAAQIVEHMNGRMQMQMKNVFGGRRGRASKETIPLVMIGNS